MSIKIPDPGEKPALSWLPLDSLIIDHNYQRDVDYHHAQKIFSEFSWNHFQVVTVTPIENGQYAVIDGQHRTVAARLHPEINSVPCIILPKMTTKEQALSFIKMNTGSKHINPLTIYWGALAAEEPEYVKLAALMDRVGVRVLSYTVSNNNLPKMSTTAINVIRNLVRRHGEKSIESALKSIGLAWPDQKGVFTYQIIKSVEYIFRTNNVSVELVSSALKTTNPHTIIADAREWSGDEGITISAALTNVIQQLIEARKNRLKRSA